MIKAVKAKSLGVSELMLRTWDKTLHRDLRVLVPIQLDALVVRTAGATRADCRMRTPEEGGSRRSVDLLPEPFADREDPLARGVHLHWAVPDGLSALEGSGTAPTPAPLPDRWLVARLSPGTGHRGVTAWIVESRTGTVTPLDAWLPTPTGGAPITALGIGDPGWVAYYDNVKDRFAFHDPLDGVSQGPLGYLVCGWYADAAADPLAASLSSLAQFEQRLAALRWALSGDDLARAEAAARARIEIATSVGLETPHASLSSQGEVLFAKTQAPLLSSGRAVESRYAIAETRWPRASLFHGAVVGLGWPVPDPAAPEVGGPPSASSISVALGRTPAEALAALIAGAADVTDDDEWLNAFALGALGDLSEPDGTVRLDDRLHDAAFSSFSDGSERVARPPSAFPEKKTPPRPPKGSTGGVTKGEVATTATATATATLAPKKQKLGLDARWKAKKALFHETLAAGDEPAPFVDSAEMVLPRPRLFAPGDPVLAVQSARRSQKYGGDGRYTPDGKLMCRLTSSGVRAIACRVSSGATVGVHGYELFERPLEHGGVPTECQELLEQLGLLDPGSAGLIAQRAARGAVTGGFSQAVISANTVTNQTAWWTTRNPNVDSPAVLSHVGFDGKLPSPLALRPVGKPWIPLHLDWEVEYLPVPARDFAPGEIDFAPPALPAGPGERFTGRSLLSAGVADSLASALKTYLAQEQAAGRSTVVDADGVESLTDVAARLATMDVLAGPLERFHLKLRRDVALDATPAPAPEGFVAVRSGFLRLTRVRLVDAYGQVLYLAGSSREQDADGSQVIIPGAARVDAAPGVLALPPRFTAPSQVSFRFRDAERTATDAELLHSPIAGFVLPDHLDTALEFFDRDGAALGQLRQDLEYGSAWELAPGLPSAVGDSPSRAILQPELAAIAQALLELGVAARARGETAPLTELLRAIDSTRWTVDPFAHVGEEHLSLLVGHPIAVTCAAVQVNVREPAIGTDVNVTRVPVRLGALTHWQDGLLGYFVAGDYRVFHCAPAAAALARPAPRDGFLGPISDVPAYATSFASDVGEEGAGATPIEHPYIDASGILWVVPGVEYRLVLLMEPHCVVHATTCLLPRKQLGMPREWLAPPLSRIAPTFRFGPVLRDAKQLRMPIPADIEGAWTWTHRQDVDRWAEEPALHAGHEALLPPDPCIAQEGWLRLTPLQKGT